MNETRRKAASSEADICELLRFITDIKIYYYPFAYVVCMLSWLVVPRLKVAVMTFLKCGSMVLRPGKIAVLRSVIWDAFQRLTHGNMFNTAVTH